MNKLGLSEYQKLALVTKAAAENVYEDCRHAGCGLMTEVGEIIDTYKRHWFYKKELDVKNLKEEIGDVLWYIAIGYFSISQTMPNYEDEGCSYEEVTLEWTLAKIAKYASNFFVIGYGYPSDWEDNYLSTDLKQLLIALHILANKLGFTLEEAAYDNIQKLAKRYPEGFSEFNALNRDKENELSHITVEEKIT